MNPEYAGLAERLERVVERVAEAARQAGRDPAEITLVAVSKRHGPEAVRAAYAAGQRIFGESYVQEALAKREDLQDLGATWHLVGRLQTNKARLAVGRFALIHSLDSLELARSLHKHALAANTVQAALLQVNLAGEAQKAGLAPDDLPALAEAVAGMPGLLLSGLMVLPPWDPDPDKSRPYFAALRRLAGETAARTGLPLPILSMGMSNDLAQAVWEGATHVRVGTDIFGARPG